MPHPRRSSEKVSLEYEQDYYEHPESDDDYYEEDSDELDPEESEQIAELASSVATSTSLADHRRRFRSSLEEDEWPWSPGDEDDFDVVSLPDSVISIATSSDGHSDFELVASPQKIPTLAEHYPAECMFGWLTSSLTLRIFSHLDELDVARCEAVCRMWKSLLWQSLVERTVPASYRLRLSTRCNKTLWRSYYGLLNFTPYHNFSVDSSGGALLDMHLVKTQAGPMLVTVRRQGVWTGPLQPHPPPECVVSYIASVHRAEMMGASVLAVAFEFNARLWLVDVRNHMQTKMDDTGAPCSYAIIDNPQGKPIVALRYDALSGRLYTGSADGELLVWDLREHVGKLGKTIQREWKNLPLTRAGFAAFENADVLKRGVQAIALSDDHVFACDNDGRVAFWNRTNGAFIRAIQHEPGLSVSLPTFTGPSTVAMFIDSRSGSTLYTLDLANPKSSLIPVQAAALATAPTTMLFHPTLGLAIVASNGDFLVLKNDKKLFSRHQISCVMVDRYNIIGGSTSGSLRILDKTKGQLRVAHKLFTSAITNILVDDYDTVVCAAADGTVHVSTIAHTDVCNRAPQSPIVKNKVVPQRVVSEEDQKWAKLREKSAKEKEYAERQRQKVLERQAKKKDEQAKRQKSKASTGKERRSMRDNKHRD